MSKKVVPIEWAKLQDELKKKHLGMETVSRGIGRSYSYLHSRRGHYYNSLPVDVVERIHTVYGIHPKLYKADESSVASTKPATVPVAPPPVMQPFELDYVKLYNIMYEAVYNAVKKAWSE